MRNTCIFHDRYFQKSKSRGKFLNSNSLLVEKNLRFSNDQTEIEVHRSKYIRLPL